MASVSFSQYSMWSSCPRQYKHKYIDNLSESTTNIHLIFGSAMHTTLQSFLSVMYGVNKTTAMNMDLDAALRINLTNEFKSAQKNLKDGESPCTKEELIEFFEDGKKINDYFKKKLPAFFSKKGYELVAIELPLNIKIKEHIHFKGFLDVVVREIETKEITIVDFKTSTKGWGKYQKTDKIKNSQILLYKKFYSEKYEVSEDMINIEFHILKRKLYENTEYTVPRISRHEPSHGKISMKKAWVGFMEFVDTVFDENGDYITNIEYPKKPSKLCEWCEFFHRNICDGK